MLTAAKAWPVFAGWMAITCGLSLLMAAIFFGIAIFVEGPLECCDFDEEERPHTPDDIPTEVSKHPYLVQSLDDVRSWHIRDMFEQTFSLLTRTG